MARAWGEAASNRASAAIGALGRGIDMTMGLVGEATPSLCRRVDGFVTETGQDHAGYTFVMAMCRRLLRGRGLVRPAAQVVDHAGRAIRPACLAHVAAVQDQPVMGVLQIVPGHAL